jgi:hypothetical protein
MKTNIIVEVKGEKAEKKISVLKSRKFSASSASSAVKSFVNAVFRPGRLSYD